MAAVSGLAASAPPDTQAANADPFDALVRQAQAELAEGVQRAGLARDPYRHLMAALSHSLGVFPALVQRLDQVEHHGGGPIDPELRTALLLEVGKGTRAGANDAMRVEAARTHRILNRDFAVRVGLSVAGAFMLGVALTYGVLRATQLGPFDRDVQAAAAWHDIEQRNPDPRQMLGAAEIRTDKPSGRRYYAGVSLWLDALGPPPGAGSRP